ncbi:MAG: hypothetical protein QXF35_00945 [Candidatus Bilamarchaeaceae archaeon]
MKAQATLEMMMLFSFTIIAIMIIAQSLLYSYTLVEEKNKALRSRAALENDLLTFSIMCNGDVDPPSSAIKTSSDYYFSLENWLVRIKIKDRYGALTEVGNFSAITLGCYPYGKKSFV